MAALALSKETDIDHPIVGGQGELSTKQIRSKIWNLAWPAIVEQILVTLVSMADMIMVGRLGPEAITAIGLSNQPLFTANAIFQLSVWAVLR